MVDDRSDSTRSFLGGLARVALLVSIASLAACTSRDAARSPWGTATALASTHVSLAKSLASSPFHEDTRGGVTAHAWSTATKSQGLILGAHLPATSQGAFDIGLATTSEAKSGTRGDFTLRFAHADLRDAKLALDDGRATYHDVAPATDLLVSAADDRVEWFYLLRDATSPTHFRLDVDLPHGLRRATMSHDGSLAFVDARGKARLAIAKPIAVDANGATHDVTLAWDAANAKLEVSLDARGLAYPVLVDPAVAYPVWEDVGAIDGEVPVRDFPAMAYDSARGKLVLFGGNASAPLGDTWEWDGTVWSQIAVATAPAAREGASIAYDRAHAKTVLFGGVGTSGNLNDLWQWDGTTWRLVTVASAPQVRAYGSMTYDDVRGKVVLFGGNGANGVGYLNDTWEWDGTSWSLRAPTSSPPVRAGATMSFDSAHAKTILFGGDNPANQPIGDSWEWDGTSWTQVAISSSPPAREFASMTYDGASGRTVLFGGQIAGALLSDTWEWDGTAWTQRSPASSPSSRGYGAMAYDSALGQAILFGGFDGISYLNNTWRWDGTTWTQSSSVSSSPPARALATMAFDSGRGKTVLFGGDAAGAINDTWEWSGTWTQRSGAQPGARYTAAMAYDSVHAKTVLFGGYSGHASLSDTWLWDGTGWTNPSPASSPSARYSAAMAYDTARGRAVVFGGSNNGTILNDTWEWDGTVWAKPTVSSSPSVRASASMAYDRTRARTVLFGGTGGGNAYRSDTWEWDGTSWLQIVPQQSPAVRTSAAMAYDSTRGRTVLFGGTNETGSFLNDTWEWDGTNWTTASVVSPSPRTGPMMSFDPHYGVVLFGGATTIGDTDDTWLYVTVAASCTTSATCDSGSCVDGVCCAQSQCGSCQSCAVPGQEGECADVPAGTIPTTGDANACTAPNMCTSSGACARPQGATCTQNGDCFTSFCVDGVCCDSACAGDCQACSAARGLSKSGTCAFAPEGEVGREACAGNLACNGKEPTCPTVCIDDASCAAGYYCNASGACVPQKGQGASCSDVAGGDCLANGCRECAPIGGAVAGQCVDGVCCDTPCAGACDACNGSASAGTCTNVARGSGGAPSCAPYVCTGEGPSCGAGCTTNTDCAGEAYCDLTSQRCVGTIALGNACTSDDACASNACVDGLCCASHCGAASSGDGGASVCSVGVCSAATKFTCELPGGVQCRAESCTGGLHTFAAVCNGTGACGDVETQPCAPFACGAIRCNTSCNVDADCADGAICNVAKQTCENGASCSQDGMSVVSNSGIPTPCSPYVCAGNACKTTCGSVSDCSAGFICTARGQCTASDASASDKSSGCGCRIGRFPRNDGTVLVALGAVIFAITRRRRPRVSRPSSAIVGRGGSRT